MQALTGRVYDRILGKCDFTPFAIHTSVKVDCAYLVTTGDSPEVPSQIARLACFAHNVVVLCTNIPDYGKIPSHHDATFVSFAGKIHNRFLQRPSSTNPTLRWNRQYDIPTKRNFALQHAISHGYATALLIDDDISFHDSFVSSAMHLLSTGADIACSYCLEDADISTLERLRCLFTGETPKVTISGNAIVLRISPKLALFPYIYNEDWLFLWASMRYGGAKLIPFQDVRQRPRRVGRDALVPMEQFGEVIVFSLFYEGGTPDLSHLFDPKVARRCLEAYRARVAELPLHGREHSAMIELALNSVDEITPGDIVKFAEHLTRELEEHYELSA